MCLSAEARSADALVSDKHTPKCQTVIFSHFVGYKLLHKQVNVVSKSDDTLTFARIILFACILQMKIQLNRLQIGEFFVNEK